VQVKNAADVQIMGMVTDIECDGGSDDDIDVEMLRFFDEDVNKEEVLEEIHKNIKTETGDEACRVSSRHFERNKSRSDCSVQVKNAANATCDKAVSPCPVTLSNIPSDTVKHSIHKCDNNGSNL
jgi:Zn finger protein HypA/HybF involved in hydrogenase expression